MGLTSRRREPGGLRLQEGFRADRPGGLHLVIDRIFTLEYTAIASLAYLPKQEQGTRPGRTRDTF